jgi:uncharacterized protein HemY
MNVGGDAAPGGEDWQARIEELLGEAEAAPSIGDRTAVLCRVAEVYERRLGDPAAALVTLQAALEQDPTSGRVVQEMERIARGNGSWNELVKVVAEVAEGLEDRKQAADLWVQIAFWSESGLAQLDDAAKAAGVALELAPDHGGALMLLEDLYRRQRSWDQYVDILARKRRTPRRTARCCATSRATAGRSRSWRAFTRRPAIGRRPPRCCGVSSTPSMEANVCWRRGRGWAGS